MVIATGTAGELGIVPNHAPLLTTLKPGAIRIIAPDQEEHAYYLSGGVLEISNNIITILADASMAAADLSEQEALKAKEHAQSLMSTKLTEKEYALAKAELMNAAGQLQALKRLRKSR